MDQVGNVCRCFCHVTFTCREPEWKCYCSCREEIELCKERNKQYKHDMAKLTNMLRRTLFFVELTLKDRPGYRIPKDIQEWYNEHKE